MAFQRFMAAMCAVLGLCLASALHAGELSKADIERRFPPPLHVSDKLKDVPAWPLTSELTPESGPVGYVFESIDLAPIPGFEGTPFNLLVAVDGKGHFMEVEVLRQHEPVFLSGLGEAPLHAFVRQYKGLNIRQSITVSSAYGAKRSGADNGGRVVLDGVTKATASIHVVNQTVLGAALAVGRARLGLSSPGKQRPPAQVKADFFESKDFQALLKDGEIVHKRWSNAQVESLFAGTGGAGLDEQVKTEPDGTFVDLYIAYLNAPTVGKALLGEAGYALLMKHLDNQGQAAYWLAATGRFSLLGQDFVRGTMPARLTFSQDEVPLEARDADQELHPPVGAPAFSSMLVLKSPSMATLDPGRGVRVSLEVQREKGQLFPEIFRKHLVLDYTPPERYFTLPPTPLPEWLVAWKAHGLELAVISLSLVLLSVVLARPRWMSVDRKRLALFRWSFLAFTLVFIGWYAQGQLSIVQITGAVKTLRAGQGLSSFLYDPVCLLLILFTLASFFVWGRGTFCGWLCPFGALQEFVAVLARRLKLPKFRLPERVELKLEKLRYVILAALVLAAIAVPQAAERMVEVEPFKTAITVGFDRSWPYVTWAVVLLLLNAAYYKFFCRFLCPLGAAITLGGRLRRWDWLSRRVECGQPCQTCRKRCEYDAIAKEGPILYDRCFQCLDCVGIYHDENRCAPLIFHAKKGRDFLNPHRPREEAGNASP